MTLFVLHVYNSTAVVATGAANESHYYEEGHSWNSNAKQLHMSRRTVMKHQLSDTIHERTGRAREKMTAREGQIINQCLVDWRKTSKTLTKELQINLNLQGLDIFNWKKSVLFMYIMCLLGDLIYTTL